MPPAALQADAAESLADATVVLTGATGFVGSFVAAHLADRGARVVAVDGADPGHRPHLTEALGRPNVRHIEMPARWPYRTGRAVTLDERFAEALPVLETADAVIHFAYCKPRPTDPATPLNGVQELAAEFELNVLPSLDLLELLGSSIRSFCFASSGLVYGHGHTRPVTEDDPAKGDTPYGLAKLAVEQAVTAWSARTEGRWGTSIRIPTVYGPGETAPRAVPNFIRRGLSGKPPQIQVAEDRRDYICATDVAAGAAAVTARHLNGQACDPVLNIATETTFTTLEVARIVLNHLSIDLEPEVGPGDRPPLKHELDSSRLRAQTGWRPAVKLVDGLADEADWFRARPELWA